MKKILATLMAIAMVLSLVTIPVMAESADTATSVAKPGSANNVQPADAATLDEVIIHEMIHCRLWPRGERGALRHGRAFHRECRRIHDEYGITVHDIAPRMDLLDRYRRKVPLYERIAYYVLWPLNCAVKPFRYLYNRLL